MELVLNRSYYRGGTNGTLTLNGNFICFMLELPWMDNHRDLSCIAEGSYFLKHRYSQRFGNHLILKSVKKRRNILICTGIYVSKDLKGSLAPISQLSGIGTGVYSRIALQKILALYHQARDRSEKVQLTIKSYSNEYYRKI